MNISRQHLMTVINGLYDLGEHSFAVQHPGDDVGTLFRVQLDRDNPVATVSFTDTIEVLNERKSEIQIQYGDRPADDLPDTQTVIRALTSAGVLEFANQQTVEQYIDRHCYPAVEAGEDPIMVGIDTNLFPWEFPHQMELDHVTGSKNSAGRQPTNGYVLSNGVVDELHWQYTHFDTDELVDAFGSKFETLADQPAGAKREGRLGIQVYQQLIGSRNVDLIDSDRGDSNIIEGYAEYTASSRKEPLLLSNDHGFVDEAHDHSLLAQRLAFKQEVPPRTTVSWFELVETLYYLTILFGVLKLPKVTLCGVWEGKQDNNWQAEEVNVDCRGSNSNIQTILARHRRIADQYDAAVQSGDNFGNVDS